MKKKLAIVLFNLGGPSSLTEVDKFLFNLFSDSNIIRLPTIIRLPIAKIISTLRASKAKKIYQQMGGKSPILNETKKQVESLYNSLKINEDYKIFISMRYSHPRAIDVIKDINLFHPDEIILLPLYPQFSSTTTGSSIKEFQDLYNKNKVNTNAKIKIICCYPYQNNFIKTHVELINQAIEKVEKGRKYRIIFSAHSLPQKIIDSGDPYQWQTEQSVQNIINMLKIENLDYKLAYQSRVGPMKWLSPSTEEEIKNAAIEKKAIIIVPISFVSEHSETLVELDIDYKKIAHEYGVEYIRVPALRCNELFIKALTKVIQDRLNRDEVICSNEIDRICPTNLKLCPYKSLKEYKILNVTLTTRMGGLEQTFLNYNEIFSRKKIQYLSVVNSKSPLKELIPINNHAVSNFSKYDPLTFLNLKKIIKKEQPTHIITHGNRAHYLIQKIAKNIPVIGVAHGYSFDYIKNSDIIFTVNKEIGELLINNYNYPANKVFFIPNVINFNVGSGYKLPRIPIIPVIGMLTRLNKEKGINIFISALQILKQEGIKFQAKIGGEGPEEDNINKQIKDSLLQNEVKLEGWVRDKKAFYESIDIFCLSSTSESFGIVILEAFYFSKPVVASNISGPAEIIEHEIDGLLFPVNDAYALSLYLRRLIESQELINNITKNAFAKVKQYDIDNIGTKILNIIKMVK